MNKKSSALHDIIPTAYEGKIDALFMEEHEEIWGKYDERNREVTVHDERKEYSIPLIDLAAKKTIQNKGRVYILNSAFMPEREAKINALFRY